jgi:hypothetical protein
VGTHGPGHMAEHDASLPHVGIPNPKLATRALLILSAEGWSGTFSRQSFRAGRSCASPFSMPAAFGMWLERIDSGQHGIMPRHLCIQSYWMKPCAFQVSCPRAG